MSFTWKKFYGEFANKLLEYKNRRQELVETIYSALGYTLNDSGTSVVNYFKKDEDTKLTDTDPFSVFAIFDKRLLSGSRTWSFIIHHPEVTFLIEFDTTNNLIVLTCIIKRSY